MIKYFAYGMNTNLAQMAGRCPTARSLGHAILPGYEFRFATHADIIQNSDIITHGVLWDITRDDLRSLDNLEGYPFYYDRAVVEVIHNGTKVRALTYYMQPGNIDSKPSQGYVNMLIEGYTAHNVPLTQINDALKFIQRYNNQEFVYDY